MPMESINILFMAHENQCHIFHGNLMTHEIHYKLFAKTSWPEKVHETENLHIQGPEKLFHRFFENLSWDFHKITVYSGLVTRVFPRLAPVTCICQLQVPISVHCELFLFPVIGRRDCFGFGFTKFISLYLFAVNDPKICWGGNGGIFMA